MLPSERPKITLKLATSLDGKIALKNGQSQWITSEGAREHGRGLRAEHDAIAIGANTAFLDNPKLTSRIAGKPNPIRIVFDSTMRIKLNSHLIATAKEIPTWVFARAEGIIYPDNCAKASRIRKSGAVLHAVAGNDGLHIEQALGIMSDGGIRSLLVEGGGTLIASFIRLGFFDILHWYRAPILLGGDGRDCVGALSLTQMDQAIRLRRIKSVELGHDLHEIYEKVA